MIGSKLKLYAKTAYTDDTSRYITNNTPSGSSPLTDITEVTILSVSDLAEYANKQPVTATLKNISQTTLQFWVDKSGSASDLVSILPDESFEFSLDTKIFPRTNEYVIDENGNVLPAQFEGLFQYYKLTKAVEYYIHTSPNPYTSNDIATLINESGFPVDIFVNDDPNARRINPNVTRIYPTGTTISGILNRVLDDNNININIIRAFQTTGEFILGRPITYRIK